MLFLRELKDRIRHLRSLSEINIIKSSVSFGFGSTGTEGKMRITISNNGSTVVARLDGEIDHHCAAGLRQRLDEEIADKNVLELVLDLKGVSFMDSSGLGVILGRYKTLAARGGLLRIINASPRVERILKMAGVYTLIERSGRRTRA